MIIDTVAHHFAFRKDADIREVIVVWADGGSALGTEPSVMFLGRETTMTNRHGIRALQFCGQLRSPRVRRDDDATGPIRHGHTQTPQAEQPDGHKDESLDFHGNKLPARRLARPFGRIERERHRLAVGFRAMLGHTVIIQSFLFGPYHKSNP